MTTTFLQNRKCGSAMAVLWAGAIIACCNTPANKKEGAVRQGASEVSRATPLSRGATWTPGERLTYDVTLKSEADFAGGAPYVITLEGRLVLTPLRSPTQGRTELVLRFIGADVRVGDVSAAPEIDAWKKELNAPYVAILKDGVRADVERIGVGVSPMVANLMRTVASALQLAVGEGTTWQSEEVDGTGVYAATYRVVDDHTVQKQKASYKSTLISGPIDDAQRTRVSPRVMASDITITTSSHGIDRVVQNETVESELLTERSVSVATRLSVVRDKAAPISAETRPREALIAGTETHDTRRPFGETGDRRMFDLARIMERPFDALLAAAEQVPGNDQLWGSRNDKLASAEEIADREQKLRERVGVFTGLTAHFRQDPATLQKAAEAILAGASAAEMMLDAMGSAGTPEAQAMLVSLIESSKLAAPLKVRGATSLIRVEAASDETLAFLKRRLTDPLLREHAVFGIGTAARRLRELGRRETSDRLSSLLLEELERAETPVEKVRCLRGIANSADPAALGAVERYAKEGEPSVRAAAVETLSFVDAPEANSMIARAMQDEDYHVRLSAAAVAANRDADEALEAAIVHAVKNDENSTVRQRCIQLLGQWMETRPQVEAVLRQVAETEAKPHLKRMAKRLLPGEQHPTPSMAN